MNSKLNNIAVKINTLRTQQGMTYQNLADKTDMTKSTLQRYENGHIANIPLHKMEILAKALNVTPAYLMGWEEEGALQNTFQLKQRDIFMVSPSEQTHIKKYRSLNNEGQDKINIYIDDVSMNPKYLKTSNSPAYTEKEQPTDKQQEITEAFVRNLEKNNE